MRAVRVSALESAVTWMTLLHPLELGPEASTNFLWETQRGPTNSLPPEKGW
jgi:hypothetical protein